MGQVEGQKGYFETAMSLWGLFPAVATLHGITTNELVTRVREKV